MKNSAVGVINGNFRSGDYFRYAQEVSNSKPQLCPSCGGKLSLPMYLVGKTDLCYGCFEEQKELIRAVATYGPNWEQDADDLHEALTRGNEMIEIEETLEWLGSGETAQFCNGAKPTDEMDEIERDWNQQVNELRGGV